MLLANTVQAAERFMSRQVRSHADKVNASVLP
jgi:hypothetical protein